MHTILIADDSATIQRAVEIVFDKEPFTVVKAGSSNETLQRAQSARPALILLDHTFPDGSGYDVLEALRRDASTASIPVIMLSGSGVPFDEVRSKAAGAMAPVQKPFDCTTLLDRVRAALGVAASVPAPQVSSTALPAMPQAPALAPRPAPSHLPRPPGAGGTPAFGTSPPGTPAFGTAPPQKPLDPFGIGAMSQPPIPAAPTVPPVAVAPLPSAPPIAARPPVAPIAPKPAAPANPFGAPPVAPRPSAPPVSAVAPHTQPPTAARPGEDPWSVRPDAGFDVLDLSDAAPAPAPRAAVAAVAAPAVAVPPIAARPSLPPEVLDKVNTRSVRMGAPIAEEDFVDVAEAVGATKPSLPPAPVTGVNKVAEPARILTEAAQIVAQKATRAGVDSKEALSDEARAIIERIAWEVVPELAEAIIREELKRLLSA